MNVMKNFYKSASTWSSISKVFNRVSDNQYNFNLLQDRNGLFNVPELTSHEGFYALKERCILATDSLIQEITSPNRSRKMVEIFDEMSDTLCKVADLAEFIRLAHTNALYVKTAEVACNAVSGIVEKYVATKRCKLVFSFLMSFSLNTNKCLYNALKNVALNGDIVPTTQVDRHIVNLFLFDFEQNGIHLSDVDRQDVVDLNDTILHVGQHFMMGATNFRFIEKPLLPDVVRNM